MAICPELERPAPVRPIVRALPSHVTPLRALAAVERDPHTVFLESGGPSGDGARWTVLAFDPVYRLEVRAGALWRVASNGAMTHIPGDPMEALARAWPERVSYESDRAEAPFRSGFMGWLSYDLKDALERYPSRARRESSLPDLSLGFHDVVFAWDRRSGTGSVVSTGLPERDPGLREKRAAMRLAAHLERVAHEGAAGAEPAVPSEASLTSNFTHEEYLRAVERALEHIAAGDIYQVNLAQRFRLEPAPSAPALFRALRDASPAPFSSLVTTPSGGIVSSSPERFVAIQGARIETWPIKGTRPRGASEAEDEVLAEALRRSAKDRAENVMIVDLERNDLGRICAIGSVRVTSLCEVERFANVHHLVSRVEGVLREDAAPVDILRATFPGGSITGAPKIRAIQIIDALEPTRRGPYTGAIGYWDVGGDCDFNIAIRTMVVENGAVSFHAGGAIVADSTPEGEYEETLVKAGGMMRALGVDRVSSLPI
jgi:para-aminobenzoate synthetase component 1